jgi:hypothetical protein
MKTAKMLRLYFTGILFLLLLIISSKGQANVIYEQLPGSNGQERISSTLNYYGGIPGYRSADDFLLPKHAIITDVHWWGEFSLFVNPGGENFNFTFYDDNNGVPGDILQVSAGSLTEVPVNIVGFGPVIFYSSILDSPFKAKKDTKYWLSVFNNASDASWVWLSTENAGNNSRQGTISGSYWPVIQNDLTFQLTSNVPEPSTMLLLGSGLIGLAGYGRKKFFKK